MSQVLTSYLNRPKIYTPDDAAFYSKFGDWPLPPLSDASIKSLLHLDGTITDRCDKAWTVVGGATIVDTAGRFAEKSLYLNGSGYLSCTHSDFAIGTGDGTWEFWVKPDSLSSEYNNILDTRTSDATGFCVGLTRAGKVFLFANNGFALNNVGAINSETYNHLALCIDNPTGYLFLNGSLLGTWAMGSYSLTQQTILFGRYYGGSLYWINGNFSEFCFSNRAKWTENFTPPTAAYA